MVDNFEINPNRVESLTINTEGNILSLWSSCPTFRGC